MMTVNEIINKDRDLSTIEEARFGHLTSRTDETVFISFIFVSFLTVNY